MADKIEQSLVSFLDSEEGSRLIKNYDTLSLEGFEDLKTVGRGIHNIRSSLAEWQGVMKEAGFDKAVVSKEGDNFVITFEPTYGDLKKLLPPDQYPTLTLEDSDGAFTVKFDGELAVNSALFLENSGGQTGAVSALSTSISEGARAMRSNLNTFKEQLRNGAIDVKSYVGKINTTAKQAMINVRSLDPRYYNNSQVKDAADSIRKVQQQSGMFAANMEAVGNRVRFDLYWKQLYQIYQKSGVYDVSNPKNEKRFTQDLETILKASNRFTDPGEFTKWVSEEYPWVMKTIWHGHLGNAFNKIIGNTSVMGAREGTPGVLGLVSREQLEKIGELDIPNIKFARPGVGSHKIQQGGVVARLPRNPNSTASRGVSKLYTAAQRNDDKNYFVDKNGDKIFKDQDLYYAIELNDDIWFNAYQNFRSRYEQSKKDLKNKKISSEEAKSIEEEYRKIQTEALATSFGDSGSTISENMADDFAAGASMETPVSGTRPIKEIEEKIKGRIKTKLRQKSINEKGEKLTNEEINDRVDQIIKDYPEFENVLSGNSKILSDKEENYKIYHQAILEELSDEMHLDSMENVSRFSLDSDGNITDIYKEKIRNIAQAVGRGGVNTDDRTAYVKRSNKYMGEAIVQGLVDAGYSTEQAKKIVFLDPNDPLKGLRVSIAREESDVSVKNFRNTVNGLWELILNEEEAKGKSRKEIEEEIKNSKLSGVVTLNDKGDWVFSNQIANERYFNTSRSGSGVDEKRTPFDYLNDLGRLAVSSGAIELPNDPEKSGLTKESDLFYVDKDTGKIKSRVPLLTAQTRYLFGGDTYEGEGKETKSGSKWNRHYIQTLEGTVGEMRAHGYSEEDVQPILDHISSVKEQLDKKQKEYDLYLKNGRLAAQTFYKDQDKLAEDINSFSNSGQYNVLSMGNISNWNTGESLVYDPATDLDGTGVGLDKNDPILQLEKLRNDKYKELKKTGSVNAKNSLQFLVDLGEVVSGNVNGQTLATRYVPLYLGHSGKQNKRTGTYMPDQLALSNRRIIKAIQEWKKAETPVEKEEAQQKLIYELRREQLDNLESIESGTIHDDHQYVAKKNGSTKDPTARGSGYMLTVALNKNAKEIYGDILKDKGFAFNEKNVPLALLNDQTAIEAYKAQWKNKEKQIREEFKAATGFDSENFEVTKNGEAKKIKLGRDETIKRLVEAYTIDSDNYKGLTSSQFNYLRNPIIKFSDDVVSPRTAFIHNKDILGQGVMSIDMNLAKTMKNDMDGDRILAQLALAAGDYDTAKDAWASYTRKLAQHQKDAKDATETEAITKPDQEAIDAFNDELANVEKRRAAISSLDIGKKGSGIYGDLAFGVADILEHYGLNYGGIQESGKTRVANLATAIAGIMYQEGINIKNTKIDSNQDQIKLIENMFGTMRQAYTWDDIEGVRHFIDQAQNLGILGGKKQKEDDTIEDEGPLFKANVFGNLGLASIDLNDKSDKSLVAQFAKIAKEASEYYKKNWGENSFEFKEIQKDIDIIGDVKKEGGSKLVNLSKEFWAVAIAGDNGLKGIFQEMAGDDKTFGSGVENLYEYIAGKGTLEKRELSKILKEAESGDFSDKMIQENQRLVKLADRIKGYKAPWQSKLDLINKAKLETRLETKGRNKNKNVTVLTSPTTLAKEKIISSFLGPQQDLKEFYDALGVLDNPSSAPEDIKNAEALLKSNIWKDPKSVRASLVALNRGTIAHEVADKLQKGEITEEQLLNLMKAEWGTAEKNEKAISDLEGVLPSVRGSGNQMTNLLPDEYGEAGHRREFIEESIRRGIYNTRFVNNRIKRRKGHLVGTEVTLAGAMTPENGNVKGEHGYSDLIYEYTDDNGNPVLVIGDYKNIGMDKDPSAENALQVMDYANMIYTLNDEVKAERGNGKRLDAESFLNQSDNNISNVWRTALEKAADKQVHDENPALDEESPEYLPKFRAAYDKQVADFKSNIYSKMGHNLRVEAELYANRGHGLVSSYRVDLSNSKLKELYETFKARNGGEITPDEIKLLEGSGAVKLLDTQFEGDEFDQFDDWFELRKKETTALRAIVDDIKSRAAKIEQYVALRDAERNELNPSFEKIQEYESKIKEESEIIGEEDDPESVLNDLKRKRSQAKGSEKLKYDEEIEKVQNSLRYKLVKATKEAKSGPGNKGTGVDAYVDAVVAQANEDNVVSEQDQALIEATQYDKYGDQYVSYIKLLRKLDKQIAEQEHLSKSKYATDEEKGDAIALASKLKGQRESIVERLSTAASALRNDDGSWKNKELENKYGAYDISRIEDKKTGDVTYDLTRKEKKKTAADVKNKFELNEKKLEDTYYKKAYNKYSDQYKYDEDIATLQHMIDNPIDASEKQIKIWKAQLENIKKQKELAAGELDDDKTPSSGYSKETDQAAQEQAQLEHEQRQLEQEQKYIAEGDIAGKKYVSDIKELRSVEKGIQELTVEKNNDELSDEEVADISNKIEELKAQKNRAIENLTLVAKALRNDDGSWKNPEEERKYGAYKVAKDDNGNYGLGSEEINTISQKAQKDAESDKKRKDISFFNKAYSVYKKQLGIDNQIWELQQNIDNPRNASAEQIKIWKSEIESLKAYQPLMAEDVASLKEPGNGYSEASDKRAQEQAKLESDMWRLQKQDQMVGKLGYGQYGGFLGLDTSVMRWVDRLMTGGTFMTFINLVKKGMSDITNKAIQLNKSMTNLRIVTGDNASAAKSLVSQYSELAEQLGTTTTETVNAAVEWTRQGYSTAEVQDLVKSSTYLSKLGMIDATAAVSDLTSAMKGFKLEASSSMDIVDKLTALDVKAATTAGDIAEGLSQFANLAGLSGVDMDQASAYVATIADVTQQSGSSVGQALKTIISRYGNVKASAYNTLNLGNDTEDSGENLNDVEKVLNKLGISIRDSSLNFKDFDTVLDEIADKWETLDTVSKKAVANAFAGVRQQESFISLMQNYDNYKEYLETSKNSKGTAEKKYESYQDSYEAAKNRQTSALEGIANDSLIANVLTDLTDVGTGLLTFSKKFLKYIPTLIAQIEGISAMFGKGVVSSLAKGLEHVWNGGGQGWYKFSGLKNDLTTAKSNFSEFYKASGFASVMNSITGKFKKTSQALDANSVAQQQNTDSKETDTSKTQEHTVSVEKDTEAENKNASTGSGSGLGLAALSWVIGGITASVSQWSTAAVTHGTQRVNALGERVNALGEKGESDVDSSERAQKVGAGISAIGNLASGIPIIGGILGTGFEHLGTLIAKNIDAERDFANGLTETANENLTALQGISSNITSIGEDLGSLTSQDAVSDFMSTLYSDDDDSKIARTLLEQYIKPYLTELGADSLYDVLNDIKEGDEDAYNALKLAQINAEKDQIINKYSSQAYENKQDITNAYTDYANANNDTSDNVYTGAGAGSIALGIGATIAGSAMVAGGISNLAVLSTLATFGLINSFNPVGWVALIAAGVAVAATGIAASIQIANEEAAEREEKALEESEWNAKTNREKLDIVQNTLEQAEIDGNTKLVDKCNTLIDALQEQISLTNEMLDEIDDLTLQAGFISAEIEYTKPSGETVTKSIADMSVSELYNAGKDAVLMAYAKGIEENGGLLNQNVWADEDHSQLSDSGYTYLINQLKSQDDEEVNSFLSGKSYTLSDVLSLRSKQGNTKEVSDLLQSFATALNVPVENIETMKDSFGALTLAETMMSTSELSERIGDYTDLVGDIADGAGQTSEWMETIIDQFPELIAYLGDIPTLFSHIGEKLNQLSEVYLESQYEDIAGNDTFYKTIKENFYSRLSDSEKEILEKTGINNVSDIMDWIQTQYGADGTLEENSAGANILQAISDTVDEYGTTVTSSILKDYYDQLIEYKTKALDTEINNLNEQKEALQEINSQREYENKLIEAKLKLEDAQKEKKRVYRAGVGWVYETDQSAVLEAQENLESVENEKNISSLEEQIAELEKEKDDLENVYSEQNNETLKNLYESFLKDSQEKGIDISNANGFLSAIQSGVSGISVSLSTMIKRDTTTGASEKETALSKAKAAWETLQGINKSANPSGYNTALQNYHNLMSSAISSGAKEEDTSDWGTGPVTDKKGNALSAWSVSQGDVEDQEADVKQTVVLPDPGTNGQEYVGQVSLGETQYDSDLLNHIFEDLDSKRGFIWKPNGSGGATPIFYDDPTNGWDARYEPKDTDGDFLTYANRLKTDYGLSEAIYTGYFGDNESVYYKDGVLYKILGVYNGKEENKKGLYIVKSDEATHWLQQSAATGSLGLDGGNTLINELGTEAIVTPSGTITSLPSHTGVVPADITKNLWELGEVAPSISRALMTNLIPDTLQQNSMNSTTDESLNVNTINITMNPDGSFDVDSFVNALRSRVALTRNSSK